MRCKSLSKICLNTNRDDELHESSIKKYSNISNPKNGYERVVENRDNIIRYLCTVAGDTALNGEKPQIRSVERSNTIINNYP